jgi:hypothetical protein
MFAGAVKEAPGDGDESATDGSWLGDEPTVTLTAADVFVAPSLSRATAVNWYVPVDALSHLNEYGTVVSDLSNVDPRYNSTRAIVPSGSLADAAIKILAPAAKVVPFDGLVTDTVGGSFAPGVGALAPTFVNDAVARADVV